jgi:hypothetical protein
MALLFAISLLVGLLCKTRMSLAPFVVVNLVLIAAVVGGGFWTGVSVGAVVANAITALVGAQAGFAAGVVIEIIRSRPSGSQVSGNPGATAPSVDKTS